SSPEDADAVNIMTVHKSKGLEFRCVSVPFSNQTIMPISSMQKEWLWVKPDLSDAEGIPQIPWIPVWSEPRLEETVHADIYRQYLDNYMTDKVNMAYVAYTRAIDELYIYTPAATKENGRAPDSLRIGSYLWRCGVEAEDIISDIKDSYPDAAEHMPSASEIHVDQEESVWSFGSPLTKEEVEAGRKKKEEEGPLSVTVPEYRCGTLIPALVYSDPTSPDSDTLPSDLKEGTPENMESEEIRRYGELMHSIMENVETIEDLPRALLKARSSGQIGRRQMEELRELLTDAMESVGKYGWFASGLRVINERGIVVDGKVRRPDRIVIRPDGTAVIIDYKFGDLRNDKTYSRQVKRYAAALLQTGITKKCEAYIWYVSLGEVISIED
ncbi:MAG: PD-(D/E)XK nuclease family protein, partial [Muribaculaceae bacterium]|nr:PD-(D/E)XK nuclease family protein [Muribaculaceae bacterium]